MKQKFDPFIIACILLMVFCLLLFGVIFISERQEQQIKAELIKEAIQKNWTPEQITLLFKNK